MTYLIVVSSGLIVGARDLSIRICVEDLPSINSHATDCTRTVVPPPRKLVGAPDSYEDAFNSTPASGFLQFWTVSMKLHLDTPSNTAEESGLFIERFRIGIFGRSGRELGVIFVNEAWRSAHVPGEHKFILLCKGRDKRAEYGEADEEDGWRYMVMLLEWHVKDECIWAERVSVGSIGKGDELESFGEGPAWKEVVLG